MSRLIFIVIVVVIVYWLLKSYRKQMPGEDAPKESDSAASASGKGEDMVRCVHCGVHLPQREAILVGGKYFCCEAHRQAHSGKSG